jgi:hypothetical protein
MSGSVLAKRLVLFGVSASVFAIILELYFRRIASLIVSPAFFHPTFALGDVVTLTGIVAVFIGTVVWACRAPLVYLPSVAVSVGVGAFLLGKHAKLSRHPIFILMIFAAGLICFLLLLFAGVRLVISNTGWKRPPSALEEVPAPISFTVRLSPADLYRAILSISAPGLWWVSLLIVLPSLIILYAEPEGRHNLIQNFAPLFVLAAVLLVMLLTLPIWTSRSLFRSQKSVQEGNRYTFSAERIEIQSASASMRTAWSNIYSVKETGSFFLVYISKYVYWLIPKKAISDSGKIVALRQMFGACVQGKLALRD